LGPTPWVLKYQDLRQKHQSEISEARMRSRLGMAISVGKIDLIGYGQVAKEGQPQHHHNPALFYRCASTPARRPSAECFLKRAAEHDKSPFGPGVDFLEPKLKKGKAYPRRLASLKTLKTKSTARIIDL